VQTHIVVTDAKGTVTAVDTGANGAFTIALRPGSYTVAATPINSPIVRAGGTTVTVPSGHYVVVQLRLDSGIR
jgi:hypothetical protein